MAKDKNCDDCVWCTRMVNSGLWCCNYLLKTGERRPCPPGEGCTVKISRKVYRRKKKNAED